MNILAFSKLYLAMSTLLFIYALVSIIFFGIRPGIDFTGGSILEISYENARPSNEELRKMLEPLSLGNVQVQSLGDRNVLFRMKDITEDTHQQILEKLSSRAEELRFESIGPVIGRELAQKTVLLITLSLLVIAGYIAFAFRKIAKPVYSWHWSLASLVSLLHDVLLPLAVLAVFDIEFTIPVVVALLTVVGYSINNNIVVFDRVRENIFRRKAPTLELIMNASIRETLSRNLATSLTTLFPLLAIFFFGGETLKPFALVLSIGISTGLYSSILFAPAFLVRLFAKRS